MPNNKLLTKPHLVLRNSKNNRIIVDAYVYNYNNSIVLNAGNWKQVEHAIKTVNPNVWSIYLK